MFHGTAKSFREGSGKRGESETQRHRGHREERKQGLKAKAEARAEEKVEELTAYSS
jgi:hypothetical protein